MSVTDSFYFVCNVFLSKDEQSHNVSLMKNVEVGFDDRVIRVIRVLASYMKCPECLPPAESLPLWRCRN